MYQNNREQEILDILARHGYATVTLLAQKLHISESSIRRDLSALQKKGLVHRSYGGAELADNRNRTHNIPFSLRSQEDSSEKRRIASAAAQLVHEGDVVFIDASSTCLYLFSELIKIKGITIVTNSIEGLHMLMDYDIPVISCGGHVSTENRAALVGPYAEETIATLHADILFFSVYALGEDGILTDLYLPEVTLRKRMMERADRCILLCSGKKVGKHSMYRMCSLRDLHGIVSDVPLQDTFGDVDPDFRFITA